MKKNNKTVPTAANKQTKQTNAKGKAPVDNKSKLTPAQLKKKKEDVQKLKEYINDSGLELAFQIIFSELINQQISPNDFFTFTARRLKEIGKEVEGMKTKDIIIEKRPKPKKEPENEEENEEGEGEGEGEEGDEVFMTEQDKKKKK